MTESEIKKVNEMSEKVLQKNSKIINERKWISYQMYIGVSK